MAAMSNQCPYCKKAFSLAPGNLEHLKKHDWLNCSKCGAFLKARLDEKGNSIVSLESYTEPISLWTFHSTKLNQDFSVTGSAMPVTASQYLSDVVCNIINNLKPDPKNPNSRVFKDQTTQNWILGYIVPKLVPIYDQYPTQVGYILSGLGLAELLRPYAVECSVCGAVILKVRQDNCPICKKA